MKIGIDCRLWNESGVGRYIRNLVKELSLIDTHNDYVLFILPKDEENVRQQVVSVRNGKWKLVAVNIRWHTVAEQIKLPVMLLKEKLDLVHFTYFSVPLGYYKPFVVTIHDLIIYHYPTGKASTLPFPLYRLKHFGYKKIIQNAANRACKIITPLKATKEDLVRTFKISEDKVVVTSEGVDSGLKFKARKLKLKINDYFLYVGNAYPHKNLDRLLQAFSVLAKENARVALVLVGKDDYFYKRIKEEVRKMALANNVFFYGEATDEELSALYQNAKALILPSLMEGFGLPAIEAMASKCLVLASDIPSLREVCGDAAIYFDPHDSEDIKQKMSEVCFNNAGNYSKNITSGLERTKMFSWRKMAEETLKVYEGCPSL